MIYDRNISDDANIAAHKMALGGTIFGDRYYVDYRNGSDNFDGKAKNRAVKTLSKAYALAQTNTNDAIFVDGDSGVAETAMITWSKNRIHVIGDNGALPIFGRGAGARITMGVTTDTSDVALLQVTGVRNTFTGLKFDSGNSLTQSVYTVADGGEYTRFNHCEFYKSTHLTSTAGAAELLCNADTGEYVHCCFGDTVNSRGASAKPRANVNFSREAVTGKVARDVVFYNCLFNQKAAHADANFMYGSGTTDIERSLTIINGIFTNAVLAAGTIADAITFGGAQTEGNILLMNPVAVGSITAFAEASQNVFIQGPVPTAGTSGISVEVAA